MLPIKTDGSKASVGPWKHLQERRMDALEVQLAFRNQDVGVGIIAGAISENLEILDVEWRANYNELWALIEEHAPGLLARLPHVSTPAAGHHLFWRCATIAGNQKLAMGVDADGKPVVLIEIRGEGGYVLTIGSPGSCHPSGRQYELLSGRLTQIPTITPEERDILLSCARSFNTYIKPEATPRPEQASVPGGTGRPGDDYNARGDALSVLVKYGWTIIRTHGDSVYLRRPGKTGPGISASFNHCGPNMLYVFSSNASPFDFERGYDPFGVYAALEHGGDVAAAARQLGKDGYGQQQKPRAMTPSATKPESTADLSEVAEAVAAATAVATTLDAQARWLEMSLVCNGMGPLNNLNNAVRVLEADAHSQGLLWYDRFLGKIMTKNGGSTPREWMDADEINLTLYMQRDLEIQRLGVDTVSNACKAVAYRNVRHSAQDWLTSLPPWDEVPRIDKFFEDHFGAEPSSYTDRVSHNFWLMLVARIMIPGCQVDNMVVLEGGQGTGKSQAMRAVGGDWFTTQHEAITGKGFFEVLQGKILIEIGEMDAFTKADITRVKDVISSQMDRYREPYERHAADHPRQGCFVGTTNRRDWNKDETGARRFWPIFCQGTIDIQAILAARDQLFAEALAVFRRVPVDALPADRVAANADWWTTEASTVEQQQERYQEDPWQEIIERHVAYEQQGDSWYLRPTPLRQLRMNDVLTLVLKIEINRMTRIDERRVGTVLTAMGWYKKVARVDGVLRKVWFAPECLNEHGDRYLTVTPMLEFGVTE